MSLVVENIGNFCFFVQINVATLGSCLVDPPQTLPKVTLPLLAYTYPPIPLTINQSSHESIVNITKKLDAGCMLDGSWLMAQVVLWHIARGQGAPAWTRGSAPKPGLGAALPWDSKEPPLAMSHGL